MHRTPEVLIVDDDPHIRQALASALSPSYAVRLAESGEEGLEQARRRKPDLVLLDLMLPQMGGLAVLRTLKKMSEDILVIIMSAYGQIQTAVQAVKLGAADYFEKPIDRERLLCEMEKILAARQPRKIPAREKIIGHSPALQRAWRLAEQFGPTDISILLQGETGTGKELFAQAIHQLSKRASGPLISIDCATVPEQLAESELFGYEQGAFTGASRGKPGNVSWAEGGTLFLDEIGALSPACQAKLLRLIEQRGYVPLGARDRRVHRLDARFISATNLPLRQATQKATFREDLYHRLTGLTIELPPLRERGDDLEPLVQHYLEQYRRQYHRPDVELSPACLDIFRSYAWPGNIRELQRVLAAAVIMADHEILPEHLPAHLGHPSVSLLPGPAPWLGALALDPAGPIDLKRVKEWAGREAEKHVIMEIQKRAGMNQQQLARVLGVDPKTLRSRLRELARHA